MKFLIAATAIMLIAFAEFNGVNIAIDTSAYASGLQAINLTKAFPNITVSGKVSSTLSYIETNNMTVLIEPINTPAEITSSNYNKFTLKYYFSIKGYSSLSTVSEFTRKAKIVNMYIECKQGSFIKMDLKLDFSTNEVYTIISDVSTEIGTDFQMYSIIPGRGYNYYSYLLSEVCKKFITENFITALNNNKSIFLNSLQTILNSYGNTFNFGPTNYTLENNTYTYNTSILSVAINQHNMLIQFDGQISSTTNGPNSSTVILPQIQSGINQQFQYILSQDYLQSQLNWSFQAYPYVSNGYSLYETDLNIYNAFCIVVSPPTIQVTASGNYITLKERCSIYTNYLQSFNCTFDINVVDNNSMYKQDSTFIYILYSRLYITGFYSSLTIANMTIEDPTPGVSYDAFSNYASYLAKYILVQQSYAPVFFPPPQVTIGCLYPYGACSGIYSLSNWLWRLYYYDGYAVIAAVKQISHTNETQADTE